MPLQAERGYHVMLPNPGIRPAIYPHLQSGGATVWMGSRPSTPDSLPVIGRARRAPNVACAFGHGRSGLTGAPLTAELVAHWLVGSKPPIDPTPYRPDRFQPDLQEYRK